MYESYAGKYCGINLIEMAQTAGTYLVATFPSDFNRPRNPKIKVFSVCNILHAMKFHQILHRIFR